MKKFIVIAGMTFMMGISCYAQDVYATVNGEKLTDLDIKPMLKMFDKKNSFSDLNAHEKELILDQSIERKLILQDAKKEKLDTDPKFQQILQDFKNRLMVEFWMKKRLASVQVSDDDIKDYFEKHKDAFAKGTKFEDVKEQLAPRVKMEKFQLLVDETLSNMKKKAKIEFLSDTKLQYK